MRTLMILTTALLLFSCSSKDNSERSNNDSVQTTSEDTTWVNIDALYEKVQYIGFVDKFYFSDKNEVYIKLCFLNREIDAAEYDRIIGLTDSLIYKDDENSRHRFPKKLASQYFDLRGLSKLKIYDQNSKFVSNADFLRVEYLNQNISPAFIAVYRTPKKIKDGRYYAISSFDGTFDTPKYSITSDSILAKKILSKLEEKNPYYGLENYGRHIRFANSDTVVSVINAEMYDYIVMTTSNDFKILYKSPYFEIISDISIIPLLHNKFPYILTRNVQPESDVMWDNLLYFDGKKYKTVKRQRIF